MGPSLRSPQEPDRGDPAMRIDIDNLFQFIVPLTFLAIWALTSLFNREAPPLPQRMGRPQPPGGPGGRERRSSDPKH